MSDPLFQPSNAAASAQPLPWSGRQLIGEVLPPDAVAVEAWDDNLPAILYPEERAQLGNAVESRLREFATARTLARQALGRLGLAPGPIRRGSAGEPLWPLGVVGSITHCAGFRAAAVALRSQMRTLGIDAEIDDPLPAEVAGSILVAEEIAWIENASDKRHLDRVVFSAKESVYKAWFPLTHQWLDFSQVAVMLDVASGAFRVRPLGSLPEDFTVILEQLSGRFLVRNRIVLTAAFLAQGA
jgi:4'-phosphopantetheinyl transferase EntD